MISRRFALTILLASISSTLLPSVSVADTVILVDTAEANHNERQVKGDNHVLRVLKQKNKGKAAPSSPPFVSMTRWKMCSCGVEMNCIQAFCFDWR